METYEEFGPPYNWCDKHCESCPLASTCPVPLREAQFRWAHTQRGEDPEDPNVVFAGTLVELQRALRIAEDEVAKLAIDLEDPIPELPISLDARRRKRAGRDLVLALDAAFADSEMDTTMGSVVGEAITVAVKLGRLEAYDEGDPTWNVDAVPNLLLIEYLLKSVDAKLGARKHRLDPALECRIEKVRQNLQRQLTALLASIPAEARDQLKELIAQGQAPSPFVTVEASTVDP